MSHSFRKSIHRYCESYDYDAEYVSDVPRDFRSNRWQSVCELVNEYGGLEVEQQILLLQLLSKLCLYRNVLSLTSNINRETHSEIRYLRTLAKYILHLDYKEKFSVSDFEELCSDTDRGSLASVNASYQMLVYCAKQQKNVDLSNYWMNVHRDYLDCASSIGEIELQVYRSRFHRAAAFIPFLKSNVKETYAELDSALIEAKKICTHPSGAADVRNEILLPALESYTKTAIWANDWVRAKELAKQRIDLDPVDIRGYLEAGEVDFRRGEFSEALIHYKNAVIVGGPGSNVAAYMAGLCSESNGEDRDALFWYSLSLKFDPKGISPRKRIATLGSPVNDLSLTGWVSTLG
ncbi:tetratricopeptide repeat protein [Ruegeria arenilitoris]|uniref:tetratricopeptide repeat protein n=1 Tax=Ruegeria arenilitoris TaxID=1173585 RepID=UPI00147B8309|nr:hypothetical protein [Ruegeria arenilitoris]